MKVSKVVLIVVALHVLVIGGIFVFEGCSRAKMPATEMAAADETKESDLAANAAALPADTLTPAQSYAPLQPTAAPMPVAPAPAPVAAARTYVVKKGDTLSKIARTERVSMAEIARVNNLTKTALLKINQKLTIPAKVETVPTQVAAAATTVEAPVPAAAVGGTQYVVKPGDSLWKIAKAHNLSVTALKQANNLPSDALKINQKITIPAGQTTQPMQAGVATPSYAEWQPGSHIEGGQTVHIVDIGESPAVIAKKYGVAVDELMRANNITDTRRIMVGQKLLIPATPTTASAPTPTPAVAAPMVSVGY